MENKRKSITATFLLFLSFQKKQQQQQQLCMALGAHA